MCNTFSLFTLRFKAGTLKSIQARFIFINITILIIFITHFWPRVTEQSSCSKALVVQRCGPNSCPHLSQPYVLLATRVITHNWDLAFFLERSLPGLPQWQFQGVSNWEGFSDLSVWRSTFSPEGLLQLSSFPFKTHLQRAWERAKLRSAAADPGILRHWSAFPVPRVELLLFGLPNYNYISSPYFGLSLNSQP